LIEVLVPLMIRVQQNNVDRIN